jgi:uncharacterized BrkB/YihY/UPF0761 family membrane protein
MKANLTKAVLGGLIGTGVMTILLFVLAMAGMPAVNPPEMLAEMMEISLFAGWLMHFAIGIIFALMYSYFMIHLVQKIKNNILRGAVFGMIIFVLSQAAMAGTAALINDQQPVEDNMVLIVIGGILGHIAYGIVVALFIPEPADA